MKVVGLLSGGKDSVYNLLHCVANGHEPIALASLGPPEGKDEIDSYMYQTVGHSGLKSIAEALNLPLFVHTIFGTAVNMDGEYGSRNGIATGINRKEDDGGTEGDETEDLYELLKKVKDAMPEVEAVACGAILSNYQRVRVEHVCSRLKLTPIAYLWERNQEELLSEMVAAGMESVLVKVAGAGLGVEHLGKSLAQMEPTLLRLNKKYQLHVCGEGGEYETFTLDCPLFRKQVVLSQTTQVVTNSDPYSTIAHLHLDQCNLVDKPDYPSHETFEELQIRIRKLVTIPLVLDSKAEEIKDSLKVLYGYARQSLLPVELQDIISLSLDPSEEGKDESASISRRGDWLAFEGITAYSSKTSASPSFNLSSLSLEEEIHQCFSNLKDLLFNHSSTLLCLSHLNLYLSPSAMSLFPQINAIYSTYFGSRPPTRACVGILSHKREEHIRLKIGGVGRINGNVNEEDRSRKSLHVQSLSYWAAANIGPYSQGITVANSRLYVAGQIALLPSTLTLPSPFDFSQEVSISLQHLRRIVVAAKENRWGGWCEGGICWIADCTEEGEWERRLEGAKLGWDFNGTEREGTEEERKDDDSFAPVLYVSASILPKGASIEWQMTYATGQVPFNTNTDDDDDDEEEVMPKRNISSSQITSSNGSQSKITVTSLREIHSIVTISGGDDTAISIPGKICSVTAFHIPHLSVQQVRKMTRKILGLGEATDVVIAPILVNHIATSSLTNQEIGLQVFSTLED